MPIPVTAKTFEYVPESIREVEGAPTFTLRYGTRGDKDLYQELIVENRLTSHDKDAFREQIKAEFRRDYKSDQMGDILDRLDRYWYEEDAYIKAVDDWVAQEREAKEKDPKHESGEPPEFEFDADEKTYITDLIEDVERHSTTIGRMNRDNVRMQKMTPKLALAVVLQETSLDVELKRDREGAVEIGSINAVLDALQKFCIEKEVPEGEALLAERQLGIEALMSFKIDREEEKNSSSLPPTTGTEKDSKASAKKNSLSETAAESNSKSATQDTTSQTETSD